jgi:hypothetical protein
MSSDNSLSNVGSNPAFAGRFGIKPRSAGDVSIVVVKGYLRIIFQFIGASLMSKR